MSKMRRFIDIGANLTDLMYSGLYNGSKKHDPDLGCVLKRSWDAGLHKIILTGGNVEESRKCLEMSNTDDRDQIDLITAGNRTLLLYATVGCHPTRCTEFEQKAESPEAYLQQLKDVIHEGKDKIVAIGECGLDYDRIQFCPKETQKKYFELQLKLSEFFKLPLFLHCRNAADDLYEILSKHNFSGVVHSFDGTIEEAQKFMDMSYYIGLNGCSLKTKENLDTVAKLPIEKILIETDCPWCEIRPSHAGYQFIKKENHFASIKKEKWNPELMVKSRNEPANIRQVLDIIAAVKNEDADNISEQIYNNSINLFFNK